MESGKRFLQGVALSVLSVLLVLGVLELAAYAWERRTAQGPLGWTLVASRRMPLERYGPADAPYFLLQKGADYLWEGTRVHIASSGFRTDEFEVPKPENVFRILNLGDSIVFGWEVAQEDTYGEVLERALTGRVTDKTVEVINAGVPGWSIETAKNFALAEGLDYDPDVLLLSITIVNDIYGRGPQTGGSRPLFRWLRDHTYTWPFLTTQARFLLARQYGPEAIPVLNPPQQPEAYFPLDEKDPTWDRVWSYIEALHADLRRRGTPLILVIFPTAFQVNGSRHPDVPQRVLTARATQAGIEVVDMLPVYRRVCEQAGVEACEGYENLVSADVWMHPNAYGHRLAAQELLGRLDALVTGDAPAGTDVKREHESSQSPGQAVATEGSGQ